MDLGVSGEANEQKPEGKTSDSTILRLLRLLNDLWDNDSRMTDEEFPSDECRNAEWKKH
jgi:hypothetical protein